MSKEDSQARTVAQTEYDSKKEYGTHYTRPHTDEEVEFCEDRDECTTPLDELFFG